MKEYQPEISLFDPDTLGIHKLFGAVNIKDNKNWLWCKIDKVSTDEIRAIVINGGYHIYFNSETFMSKFEYEGFVKIVFTDDIPEKYCETYNLALDYMRAMYDYFGKW